MSQNTDNTPALVSDHITSLLEKLLQKNEIVDYKITITPGSIRGDNYLGVIAKVHVQGVCKNNEKQINSDYIVKSAPTNEAFRKLAPIRLAYEREIYMYSVVLPEFYKLQEERGVQEPFNCLCKCYTTSLDDKEEALIMEDMKSIGYIMRDRHEPLDYNHAKLVFKQYAKLHAFSFALRDQNPELFNRLANNCEDSFMSNFNKDDMRQNSTASFTQAKKAFHPENDKMAIEKFEKFMDDFTDIFYEVVKSESAGEYAVIGHGDSWLNNMLFKYGDSNHPDSPTNLCILDWQLARCASPTLDLSYFLYTCTDKELRDDHFEDLLKEYHATFCQFLKELGSDGEKLFPYSVLESHFKKFAIFGLIMSVMVIRLMTSEVDEIPDIVEVVESKNYEAFQYESKNSSKYYKRIRDVVYHCITNGTL